LNKLEKDDLKIEMI
jgi:hypothetical protein